MTNVEYVIAYEALIVEENGDESWVKSEQAFAAEDALCEYVKFQRTLEQYSTDGVIRNITHIKREVSEWLF